MLLFCVYTFLMSSKVVTLFVFHPQMCRHKSRFADHALRDAVYHGYLELTQWLHQSHSLPLHCLLLWDAAQNGHTSLVEWLIDKECDRPKGYFLAAYLARHSDTAYHILDRDMAEYSFYKSVWRRPELTYLESCARELEKKAYDQYWTSLQKERGSAATDKNQIKSAWKMKKKQFI